MKVYHTIQSPGNEPVTYSYSNTTDAIGAAAAVTALLATDFSDVPESIRPETLSIVIEM